MGLAGKAARIFPRREVGVLRMSRAGRKRKTGARHPSGQLKKEKPKKKEIDDKVRTQRQPHRRELAHQLRAGGADQIDIERLTSGEEAESPIGRLWARGLLKRPGDSDSQAARDRFDAGNMFAQIVGAYRSVIEAPRDVAGSGRGFPCRELLCALARENCECEHRKARYDRAFEALQRLGMRALKAVNRVAVHREAIDLEELVYLVSGLEELRRVFGLTAHRKPKQYRNAK
jgi:hypothetical protein